MPKIWLSAAYRPCIGDDCLLPGVIRVAALAKIFRLKYGYLAAQPGNADFAICRDLYKHEKLRYRTA